MITLGNLTGFLRSTLRDGCTGKRAFSSYAEAEGEIGNLIRKHAHRPELGTLGPYLCSICRAYHLGHTKD